MRLRCGFALALMLGAAPSRAEPPPIPRALRLEYTRGAGAERCDAEQDLKDRIASHMTFDPFVSEGSSRLVVSIQRKGRNHDGRAEVVDAAGSVLWSFPVVGRDCRDVVDGLSLAIGVALDPPGAKPPATRPPPAPPPAPEPAPDPPPLVPAPRPAETPSPARPPPAPPPERPPLLALQLGFGGALALRSAPAELSLSLAAAAGLRYRAASLSVELRWSPSASAEFDRGARISATRLAVGLAPCGHYRSFFGCGVAEGFMLLGVGTHVMTPASVTLLGIAAGPRVGMDTPLVGRFSLRTSVDLLATVHCVALRIDDKAQWAMPSLSGAVAVGILAAF